MHRAFQLDEIVSSIATQVASTKCADVVKFARACKALAAPCLDILWSNYQHEFLPLIMCLPRDCFAIDDDGFESLFVSGCSKTLGAFVSNSSSPAYPVFYTRSRATRMDPGGPIRQGHPRSRHQEGLAK